MNNFSELVVYVFSVVFRSSFLMIIGGSVFLVVFPLLYNFVGLPMLDAAILAMICGQLSIFILFKLLVFWNSKDEKENSNENS